jgi:hypothetical protein
VGFARIIPKSDAHGERVTLVYEPIAIYPSGIKSEDCWSGEQAMRTINPYDAGILRHLEYQNTVLIAMLGKPGVNLDEVLHKTGHKHS